MKKSFENIIFDINNYVNKFVCSTYTNNKLVTKWFKVNICASDIQSDKLNTGKVLTRVFCKQFFYDFFFTISGVKKSCSQFYIIRKN